MPKNTRQTKIWVTAIMTLSVNRGIEKWGEQYLRGIDGTTGTTKEVNGKEIAVMNDAEPVPGDYIVLTLDSDLQKVAEKIACRYNTKYSCVKRCESKGRCRL